MRPSLLIRRMEPIYFSVKMGLNMSQTLEIQNLKNITKLLGAQIKANNLQILTIASGMVTVQASNLSNIFSKLTANLRMQLNRIWILLWNVGDGW